MYVNIMYMTGKYIFSLSYAIDILLIISIVAVIMQILPMWD